MGKDGKGGSDRDKQYREEVGVVVVSVSVGGLEGIKGGGLFVGRTRVLCRCARGPGRALFFPGPRDGGSGSRGGGGPGII